MEKERKQTFSEMIRGSKPVLVDFYADWCGPCKMMAPILEEFSAEMGDSVKVVKVDVDRNPQAASVYHVQGVPTLMLFKSGQVVWRQSGVATAGLLRQVVAPHSKKDPQG